VTLTRYQAFTAYGVLIQGQPVFETRAEAIRWALLKAQDFPGLKIKRITETRDEAVIWREGPRLRVVGDE